MPAFRFALLMLMLCVTLIAYAQQPLPYKNPSLPVDMRVKDLHGRMTIEKKMSWQLFIIPGDLDGATADKYKNGIFGFQVSAGSQGNEDRYATTASIQHLRERSCTGAENDAIQKYFIEQTRLGIPIIAFDEALHGLVYAEQQPVFPGDRIGTRDDQRIP